MLCKTRVRLWLCYVKSSEPTPTDNYFSHVAANIFDCRNIKSVVVNKGIKMESPIQNIIDWYLSLPKIQRTDIAVDIGVPYPGFRGLSTLISNCKESDFIEILQNSMECKHTEVGMAILLREAVEFSVISNRSNPDNWKKSETIMRSIAENHNDTTFSDAADQKKIQEQQWKTSFDKWQQVKINFLNDEYLNQYDQ